jgi:hypothetical protein
MTEEQIEKIKDDLCAYDERNPLYDSENGGKSDNCFCDNCFYGRTRLAEIILGLLGIK